MYEPIRSEQGANTIDDQMVREMEERRKARPERRVARKTVASERRRHCTFCHQPGDHPTPVHCLRALER
jgi:hypothetical protein